MCKQVSVVSVFLLALTGSVPAMAHAPVHVPAGIVATPTPAATGMQLPPPTGTQGPPATGAQAPPPVGTQAPLPGVPLPAVSLRAAPSLEASDELPLIGHDSFNVDLSTIDPGPVDGTYVLSPGDEVTLRVWGQLQLNHMLTVSPDQFLEIPDVPGRVYIGDLSLADVADRLTRHLATSYATYFDLDNPAASSAFLDVGLGKVRGVRFIVQGEVVTPGSYTLHPSLSNLIYAIAQAGGVKDTASLRDIRIRRGPRSFDVDFYEFLLKGNVQANEFQIRNNDVIFVQLKRKEVAIQGEVRRPGYYALNPKQDEDLQTALEFAGGVKPSANTERLLIRRIEVNTGPRTISINLEEEASANRRVLLQDQDVVTVIESETTRRDFVSLKGNGVKVPGDYPFTPGMMISDLLMKAGGLRPDAYQERAGLIRTGRDLRKSFIQLNLQLASEGDPAHNVALESLDELIVDNVIDVVGRDGEVTLKGHVKSPGVVPLSAGMRLYDLLFTRAGLQDADFMRESYLPRADLIRVVSGSTRQALQTFDLGKLLAGDPTQNLVLQSDDEVVVYSRDEILGTDRFVELSGFVRTDGLHPLLQGTRLADLLKGPGGFEDPDRQRDAYLPRVEIWRKVRKGATVELELLRFDLGAALNGDAAHNPLLESGDLVVTYAAADFNELRSVEIDGAVNKPGAYLFASNMTLGDLLIQAGGLKSLADTTSADLFRMDLTTPDKISLKSLSVPLSDQSFALQNGDRLLIRMRAGYQDPSVVEVEGQVQYPGRYTLPPTAGRVADAIRMAGGLLGGAYLDGAALYRLDDPGAESIDDEPRPSSRIVLDFARALESPSSPDNLLLEDGDRIVVSRRSDTVTVVDEVQQPTTIAFAKGKGVKYYLQAAGGPTAAADEDAVAVILPSGRYAPKRFLRGPEVLPGSTIVVPARPGAAQAPIETLIETSAEAIESTGQAVASRRSRPQSPQPTRPAPQTGAPAGASTPPPVLPESERGSPAGPTTMFGTVEALSGVCPAVAFDLAGKRVTTTEGTAFLGVLCADLKVGDVLQATVVPQTDRIVAAIEIRRR